LTSDGVEADIWFCCATFTQGVKGNGKKVIPLQTWTDPEGSSRLKLPDFKTFGSVVPLLHKGSKVTVKK